MSDRAPYEELKVGKARQAGFIALAFKDSRNRV